MDSVLVNEGDRGSSADCDPGRDQIAGVRVARSQDAAACHERPIATVSELPSAHGLRWPHSLFLKLLKKYLRLEKASIASQPKFSG